MDSFYSKDELITIGFKSIGEEVLISKKASIYDANKIIIGNHVRIDDFCILSGNILIGDYVHISAYSCIFAGDAGVEIGSFSGLSSRCAIYAISDDYSGQFLSNAMVPIEFRKVKAEKVIISDHVIIGSGTTILPGIKINKNTAVGCMSLVNKSLLCSGVYCGIPAKKIKERKNNCVELEKLVRLEKGR